MSGHTPWHKIKRKNQEPVLASAKMNYMANSSKSSGKSDSGKAGVNKVDVDGSTVDVYEVTPLDGEKYDAEQTKVQNEALMHYRATGDRGVYVDPSRDQEPDIAPEIGVSPHPEFANPAPPEASFDGQALDASANPVVKDVATKTEDNKEASEAFSDYVAKREESFKANPPTTTGAPSPVYVVDKPDASAATVAAPGPDESAKASQSDPSRKA